SLFEIEKPIRNKGIGIDRLPESVRNSSVLTGNNLGQLGNVEELPDESAVKAFCDDSPEFQNLITRFGHHPESFEYEKHLLAQTCLLKGEVKTAWLVLLG